MNNLFLLTIIAEEALSNSILNKMIELGAKGYTTYSVSGKGLNDVRDNPWEGENIKIETIVSEEICNLILGYLQEKYFDQYAIIVFYNSVNVIRTSHFI
jgi:hypothetical protein